MTDNLESILESIFVQCDRHPSHLGQSLDTKPPNQETADDKVADDKVTNPLTLNLPADIVAALRHYAQQTGRSQPQMIAEILRSALGVVAAPPDWMDAILAVANDDANSRADAGLTQASFNQLEDVRRRVEVLEGKSIAF
jgi:plasmid stability protein